ncbi:MAG: GNAT family N-acetyltransferase, partial [Acidimicrobiia bacterium]|nr:GNAT family N-acetyltransferase [Acidimicrobiia bacterium]
ADECDHWVGDGRRGQGIGTWLMAHGAEWLRLGGTRRLLAYGLEDERLPGWAGYYARFGLVPINRTVRGWRRTLG